MSILYQKYNAALLRSPIVTKTLTTSALMAGGDLACQVLAWGAEEGKTGRQEAFWSQRFDARRLGNMAFFGLFLGPWLHCWYKGLERMLPTPAAAAGAVHWGHIAKRTAVDQAVNGPFICFGFFAGLGLLEGHSPAQIEASLRQHYLNTVLLNWGFWCPAMALNFRFLSPAYRVLGVNVSALAWNTALSYIRFESEPHPLVDQE
ncbi:MAG: Mpv17/PMP22 family protein [archaeon]|nr:Mpv17/PMP22 family protein [archaeon]